MFPLLALICACLATAASPSLFSKRLQGPTGFQNEPAHFNIALYRLQHAFLWPAQIPVAARPTTSLTPASEIIYNDTMILAQTDELYATTDTGLIALVKVPLPGLLFLEGPAQSIAQIIDSRGLQQDQTLPLAWLTWQDTTRPLLLSAPGCLSQEFDPQVSESDVHDHEFLCDPLPRLRIMPRFVDDRLEVAPMDSALLPALDQRIAELAEQVRTDSMQIERFLDSVQTSMFPLLPLLSYEDSAQFRSRVRIHQVETIRLLGEIRRINHFTETMLPVRSHLVQLRERRAKRFPVGQTWWSQKVWNHMNLMFGTTLGRNLPAWVRPLGVAGLWGVTGGLEYVLPITSNTAIIPQLRGAHSEWSHGGNENAFGGSIAWAVPLWIPKAHNFGMQARMGALALWRKSETQADSVRIWESGMSFGGTASLHIYCTKLPVQVALEYQYTNDGFGDLNINFALPLFRLGGSE